MLSPQPGFRSSTDASWDLLIGRSLSQDAPGSAWLVMRHQDVPVAEIMLGREQVRQLIADLQTKLDGRHRRPSHQQDAPTLSRTHPPSAGRTHPQRLR